MLPVGLSFCKFKNKKTPPTKPKIKDFSVLSLPCHITNISHKNEAFYNHVTFLSLSKLLRKVESYLLCYMWLKMAFACR